MPFYEYQCQACGHEVEELQKLSDPVLTQCPSCNKETLEKIISATGFQLTGTGWYATDFKDKKPQASTTSENPVESSAQTEKKAAPKIDTKKADVKSSSEG